MVQSAVMIVALVIVLITIISLREFGRMQTAVALALAVMLAILVMALVYLTAVGV